MTNKHRYLSSDIPEKNAVGSVKRSEKSENSLDRIREELDGIQEQLTKQNRDSLDAMYNIGIENLDESLTRMISETGNAIASLVIKTDANSASIEALAQWKDGTGTDSLAGFVANATKDFATVSMLASYTNENDVNNLINQAKAGIIADARDGMATISMLASYTTTNDVNGLISSAKAGIISEAQDRMATVSMIANVTDSTTGKVTAASIVTAVNKTDSSVKIKADHVDISGFVTFSDLKNEGASTINGNNISLISNRYGNSESSITFQKKKSTGIATQDFFKIYTIDNSTENDDEARFAVLLETCKVQATDGYTYGTALKLIGNSISIEPAKTFYVSSLYATIDSERNLGVRANQTGETLETLLPNGKVSDTYYFCTDGIYYGTKKVLSV